MPDPQAALELRRAGVPLDRIAAQLGYQTEAEAALAIAEAMPPAGSPADIRQLEADRMDALQQGLWSKARKGDLAAIDRILRLTEMRVRLAGIPEGGERMQQAFASAVAALQLRPEDAALLAAGQRICEQLDRVAAVGDSVLVMKSLYLLPHLVNVLQQLGATPAAREQVMGAAEPEPRDNELAAFKRRRLPG